MSTVYLHVGALKTGTTYLQQVLLRNRDVLAARSVLFPGRTWGDQVTAVEEVVGRRPRGKPATPGAWARLVEEIQRHDGPVVVSMETFASADAEVAHRVVADLAPRRVRVVVTARDPARVITAQWQEWMKNGGTMPYRRYLRTVSMTGSRRIPVVKKLWWNLDLKRILTSWQPAVAPGDVVLVTVPPPGSPRDLLWRRFAAAIETDPDGFDLDVLANESLGAASAELARRINLLAEDRELTWRRRQQLKHGLYQRVLAQRRAHEPPLVLPQDYWDFASRTADRMVSEVSSVGPVVVGSLDDLRPRFPATEKATTTWPEDLSDDLILGAAIDGLLGLVDAPARPGRRQPAGSDDGGDD